MARLRLASVLCVTLLSTVSAHTDLSGKWKAAFDEPLAKRPKMFSEVVFDLKIDGDKVSGTATMMNWPGVCTISDGHVDGDHFTFYANGTLGSSSGYPRIKFEGTVKGDDMTVTFTWGFVGGPGMPSSAPLKMIGKRTP